MRHNHSTLLAALPFALLACNQADPPPMTGTDGSTSMVPATSDSTADSTGIDPSTNGSDSSGASADVDYFPLRDGATWTYRHIASDGTTFDEIVVMREITFDGGVAFEMEDNAGADGENTVSTVLDRDGQVMRVHKEVLLAETPVLTVDYVPGFLRFDNGWADGDVTDWMYDRTEYDGTGALADEAVRQQIFTIESMSTPITVPAGTFDCVQFLRNRPDTGESKRFWFADGVGKIKHETLATGSVEELAEYSIP